ncbi:MAG: hypothetical protein JST24_02170 [Acidobacteria bacterium]|nr:hypothetical protein [Acidobacteriota bacterium]
MNLPECWKVETTNDANVRGSPIGVKSLTICPSASVPLVVVEGALFAVVVLGEKAILEGALDESVHKEGYTFEGAFSEGASDQGGAFKHHCGFLLDPDELAAIEYRL